MSKQHSECALCGKTIVDLKDSSMLEEVIGGISYNFDTNECVMMYKRFRSVYGDDFKFLAPQEQFVSDHFWDRAIPTEQEIRDYMSTYVIVKTSTRNGLKEIGAYIEPLLVS